LRKIKIAFVCSPGGHLVQACQISKNLNLNAEKILISQGYIEADFCASYEILDANIRQPIRIIRLLLQLVKVLRAVKPDIIISTGAGPGAIALLLGKIFNIETIWVDSVANVKKASLSGRITKYFADIWISQWLTVAQNNKGIYIGKLFRIFNSRDTTNI
jgi:UDP-N-acetylglucosamine:LPS N-acetylglucosamine transferase